MAMEAQTARLKALSEPQDPRIRRSRRMLHDALAALLATKEFDKISIQEIAEASTLNRATFYDHYPDKFALLECMVGSRFAELMAIRNVQVTDCAGALRALALGVCDYLAEAPAKGGKSHEGSMQAAIVGVIRTMLLEGLREQDFGGDVTPDIVASTVAWAIYGAANAWMHTPERCSAEQIADVIDTLISPVFSAAAKGRDDKAATHGRDAHSLRS
jgi:AcrR family transcriptional regulator